MNRFLCQIREKNPTPIIPSLLARIQSFMRNVWFNSVTLRSCAIDPQISEHSSTDWTDLNGWPPAPTRHNCYWAFVSRMLWTREKFEKNKSTSGSKSEQSSSKNFPSISNNLYLLMSDRWASVAQYCLLNSSLFDAHKRNNSTAISKQTPDKQTDPRPVQLYRWPHGNLHR